MSLDFIMCDSFISMWDYIKQKILVEKAAKGELFVCIIGCDDAVAGIITLLKSNWEEAEEPIGLICVIS